MFKHISVCYTKKTEALTMIVIKTLGVVPKVFCADTAFLNRRACFISNRNNLKICIHLTKNLTAAITYSS